LSSSDFLSLSPMLRRYLVDDSNRRRPLVIIASTRAPPALGRDEGCGVGDLDLAHPRRHLRAALTDGRTPERMSTPLACGASSSSACPCSLHLLHLGVRELGDVRRVTTTTSTQRSAQQVQDSRHVASGPSNIASTRPGHSASGVESSRRQRWLCRPTLGTRVRQPTRSTWRKLARSQGTDSEAPANGCIPAEKLIRA